MFAKSRKDNKQHATERECGTHKLCLFIWILFFLSHCRRVGIVTTWNYLPLLPRFTHTYMYPSGNEWNGVEWEKNQKSAHVRVDCRTRDSTHFPKHFSHIRSCALFFFKQFSVLVFAQWITIIDNSNSSHHTKFRGRFRCPFAAPRYYLWGVWFRWLRFFRHLSGVFFLVCVFTIAGAGYREGLHMIFGVV